MTTTPETLNARPGLALLPALWVLPPEMHQSFLKEQELIGWAHRDTLGLFESVCSITETVTLSNGLSMNVDAVYVVVKRMVNGNTIKYVERMAERIFPYGVEDAWTVDSGLQSAPATTSAQTLAFGCTLTASQAAPVPLSRS